MILKCNYYQSKMHVMSLCESMYYSTWLEQMSTLL